jgi:hypothetical protein
MRAQARKQRVLEHDARAPGETRPRWLYRISQHGLDEVARTLGLSSPTVGKSEQKNEPGIFLRDSTQHAISGLRSALHPEVGACREWVEGETGWRSAREFTTAMAEEDDAADRPRYRWFNSEDLRWLVRLGFVEERVIGRTHVYRLLPAGAALKPLEWREPRNG